MIILLINLVLSYLNATFYGLVIDPSFSGSLTVELKEWQVI